MLCVFRNYPFILGLIYINNCSKYSFLSKRNIFISVASFVISPLSFLVLVIWVFSLFKKKKNYYLLGYTRSYLLHMEPLIFVVACGIWFPDQGSNPSPLHWEHRVLAPGPPRKSLEYSLSFLVNLAKSLLILLIIQKFITQFYWFFSILYFIYLFSHLCIS